MDKEAEQGGEESSNAVPSNPSRALTILTWAKAAHKHKPDRSQKNYSVEMISIRDQGLNLKRLTGRGQDIQNRILAEPKFVRVMKQIVREVEENDYTVISVCCAQGRHRSVAIAELLRKLYYPSAEINHLDL